MLPGRAEAAPVSTKSAGNAKQSQFAQKNLIVVNYWPRGKLRCFGFMAASSSIILAA
jgi:hypothetical protein